MSGGFRGGGARAAVAQVGRSAVAALFAAPLLLLVVGSLRPTGTAPPITVDLIPDGGLTNYRSLLDTPSFVRQTLNSILIAAIAVPLGTLVASWAGYAAARLPKRDATVLVAGVVFAASMPPTSLFLGRLLVFRGLGLTDTPGPLIAPALLGVSPLLVLLFAWAYRTIPSDAYDLAKEVGLRPFATWWRVALPMRRGVAFAAAAVAFVVTWGNLIDPLLYVYDERWFTLPLGIATLAELPPTDQGLMLAGAMLTILPVVLVVLGARIAFRASTRSTAIAATLLLVTPVACTGSAGGPTEITVMVAGDPEEIDAYRAVVEGFNDSQDDVVAELLPFADRDDLIVRLSTSIAGGQPPDLFLMNYRFYGQFAARGALEPLGSFLEGSSAFSTEDFFETAMRPFRWEDEQMCMPQNVSSLLVYYNADLFRERGVPEPTAGWTWDDMVRAAERLTDRPGGDGAVDVYGLGVDPEVIRIAPAIWSNGGSLVAGDPPTGFDFDGPAVQAIDRFLALRSVHGVTPTDEEVESEDLETRFLRGRLGMLMESRRVVPTFRTIDDFIWDVAPFPSLRAGSVSILHSDAYCMTARSDAKSESWRFLEFALGPEGQRIAAGTGRTVPSLRSVADSDAFLDPAAAPAHARAFLDQVPALRSVPVIATWPEIEDIANGLLEEAYYGDGRALEVAIEVTQATRTQFGRAA